MLISGAVAAVGLAAGLLAWAPWLPPAVLRPAGLAKQAATADSITVRWSQPPTGPLPDRYLIVANGRVTGSVAGTVTSYRQAGLDPGTASYFRVIAVRGGKRSPQSAQLTASTLTPPLSQARLRGPWIVDLKYADVLPGIPGGQNGPTYWHFSAVCAVGACNVILRQKGSTSSFRMRLTHAGAVYQGQTAVSEMCGLLGDSVPDPGTLTVRLHITAAGGQHQAWIATSFSGTMVTTYQRVALNANSSCRGDPIKAQVRSVN